MANDKDWKRDEAGNYLRLQFVSGSPEIKVTNAPRYGNVTGYGPKQPTSYMVWVPKRNGGIDRWHRVYCAVYGNAGSAYIQLKGEHVLVEID